MLEWIRRLCSRSWKDEEVVLNHTRKEEGPTVTYVDMEAPDWKAQLEGALLKTEEAAKHGDR